MIRFELTDGHGRPFNAERFAREMKEGILKAADAKIQDEVRRVRCPIHGQYATITRTLLGQQYRVRGCCQTLIDTVNAKLRQ